jgi:hypothetical protein
LSPRNGLGEDRNHGGADMAQVRTWVGLDVHAAKVVAAIADAELDLRRWQLAVVFRKQRTSLRP